MRDDGRVDDVLRARGRAGKIESEEEKKTQHEGHAARRSQPQPASQLGARGEGGAPARVQTRTWMVSVLRKRRLSCRLPGMRICSTQAAGSPSGGSGGTRCSVAGGRVIAEMRRGGGGRGGGRERKRRATGGRGGDDAIRTKKTTSNANAPSSSRK